MGGLKMRDRKWRTNNQKVENAGLENAGPWHLSDSSLKLWRHSTDIGVMNVTYAAKVQSILSVGKPQLQFLIFLHVYYSIS